MKNLTKLKKFLGTKRTKEQEYTHMGIDDVNGKYNVVDSNAVKTLHEILSEVENKNIPLTERHGSLYDNILIDLDFKFNPNAQNFERPIKFIPNIIEIYNKLLIDMSVPKELLEAVVTARNKSYPSKGVLKDGIHIQYPLFCMKFEDQFDLRLKAMKLLNPLFAELELINDIDNVVDIAVIKSNGWMHYGCSKTLPKSVSAYLIHSIYNCDGPVEIPKRNWVDYLSLQLNRERRSVITVKKESIVRSIPDLDLLSTAGAVSEVLEKAPAKIKINIVPKSQADTHNIKILLDMLSQKRCDDYGTWSQVGMVLARTDSSLIELFREWSKKSTKYKQEVFENHWQSFSKCTKLTLGSLHYWAKHDSPKEYAEFRSKQLDILTYRALSGTDIDVANFVKCLIGDNHVFVGKTEKPNWYWFNGLMWVADHNALSVRRELSTTVLEFFTKYHDEQIKLNKSKAGVQPCFDSVSCTETNDTVVEEEEKKESYTVKASNNLTFKLRSVSFINKIIIALEPMLIDYTFRNKLDANPDLLGFDDGVYDLILGAWRPATPFDYVSMSVGKKYNDIKNLETTNIEQFLKEIITDKDERDYTIDLIATCLNGHAIEQLNVYSGTGANGKSRFTGIIVSALGGYATNAKVSILMNDDVFKANGASEDIHMLKGMRFVCVSEPPAHQKIKTAIMKMLLGGSSEKITSRGNYQSVTTWCPHFKLFMSCNDYPLLDATDFGTARRIRVLMFNSTFLQKADYEKRSGEKNVFLADPQLTYKIDLLSRELLKLLLDRYATLENKTTIKPTKSIEYASEKWLRKSNIFISVLDDILVTDNENTTYLTFKSLWDKFKLSDSYKELTKSEKREITREKCFNNFKQSAYYTTFCDKYHPNEQMCDPSVFNEKNDMFLIGYKFVQQD